MTVGLRKSLNSPQPHWTAQQHAMEELTVNRDKRNNMATTICLLMTSMLMMGAEADCSSGGPDILPPPLTDPLPSTKLTLLSLANGAELTGYDGADLLNTTELKPSQRLDDSPETVDGARGFALDRHGALYLCSAYDGSIAVYDDPRSASGSKRPNRRALPTSLQSEHISDIAIDTERDELYLVDGYDIVFVFDISEDADFDGRINPIRAFTIDVDYFTPQEVEFSNGSLYVADARARYEVFIFDDPRSLDGLVKVDRTFTHIDIELDVGLHVDAWNRLLIANRKIDKIMIWKDALQLDGSSEPDVILNIDGVLGDQSLEHAVTDSNDRLYVLDNGDQEMVYVFDDISTLSDGYQMPDREFAVDTSGSGRLLVFE